MGDYIKREDAIKAVADMLCFEAEMDYCDTFTSDDFIDDAKEWLSGCPSADRPQEWIPCSERLPKEEGWYLVTIQNDKTEKRRTENDLFAIGIAEAHKLTPYKFCKDGHRQTVIAWMPLPKPWKGADDE